MLNATIKRHIKILGGMYLRGERATEAFRGYIHDAAKAGIITRDDAKEIYDLFMDSATDNIEHDRESTAYRVQIIKVRRIIEDANTKGAK